MSALRDALDDYLAVRRALGYKLARPEKLLHQFLSHLEDRGEERVTTKTALDWATLPKGGQSWLSYRLSAVRGFAIHLRAVEPATEVPPTDLLPWRKSRATPYLYSDDDICALSAAAETLRTPYRVLTYRTLIGLLAVTGMRVGEAIGLDQTDFDAHNGLIVIRKGKFGKSRELPLHATARDVLRQYLHTRDRPRSAADAPAIFVSTAGTRLLYCNVHSTFRQLVLRAGLKPKSASCRPRIHDLRHSFAVRTVLDAYREDGDPKAQLARLSTYLGHVDPGRTYWYLSAAPELLALAGGRLERHLGGTS